MSRAFDRVFIIMFENELESAVLQDDYMRALQARGVRLSDYHGVTHPSQPNYVAAVAGLPFVTDDDCQDIEATSIVDLLEAKGVTWKAYMEDLPEDNKAVCISADGLYYPEAQPVRLDEQHQEQPGSARQDRQRQAIAGRHRWQANCLSSAGTRRTSRTTDTRRRMRLPSIAGAESSSCHSGFKGSLSRSWPTPAS